MQLAPGTVIEGKYKITRLLGSGGMGSVYAAEQEELGRKVAVKILHYAVLENDIGRQRFEREAKLLSTLQHVHLVTMYAFGLYAETIPYLVTELVEGSTLAGLILEKKMHWRRALTLGIQVCQALEYVHEKGVVHRDLKPQNIMLVHGPADFVKVLDFGLARALNETGSLTKTGELVGSVHYLSPEQCAGKRADKRSDVYSLACVLYECICGRPPFQGDSSVRLIYQHTNEAVRPPSEILLDKDFPLSLDKTLLKALQKDPENRFQSMAEFEESLSRTLAGATVKVKLVDEPSKQKAKALFFLPAVIFAACLSVLLAFGVLKHQQSVRKSSVSANDARTSHLLEAKQQLDELERGAHGKKSTQLSRSFQLISRACGFSKAPIKPNALEFQLIEQFVRVCRKEMSVDERQEKLVNQLDVILKLERNRQRPHNEGLFQFFLGKMKSPSAQAVAHFSWAAVVFAEANEWDLAAQCLNLAEEQSSNSESVAFVKMAKMKLDYLQGNTQSFKEGGRKLLAEARNMQAAIRAFLYFDIGMLAEKDGNLQLAQESFGVLLDDKYTPDGLLRDAYLNQRRVLKEQRKYKELLKVCVKVRDSGFAHGNSELVDMALEEIKSLAAKGYSLEEEDKDPGGSRLLEMITPYTYKNKKD